jgi:hypothetical protein
MALFWPQRPKKRIPSNLGGQLATLGANMPEFIIILRSMVEHNLGPISNIKMLKVGPKFFLGPDS